MFLSNRIEESKSFNRADINRMKRDPKIASFSYKQFSLQGKTNSFPKLILLNNNLFPNILHLASAWNNHPSSQVLICRKTWGVHAREQQ